MCAHIFPIKTKTKFVILMHTKEYRKIKNGTGIFSHLSLPNSELFIGVDFSKNQRITDIVEDKNNNCFILYPSKDSILLNEAKISQEGKTAVIFLIDATWSSAKKMIRVSQNIKDLPRLSFYHDTLSAFHIKAQPEAICLSTMESIHQVLGLLEEDISKEQLKRFLNPFHEMVKYQMQYT
jgi:DTW domain-containing protein YfiP